MSILYNAPCSYFDLHPVAFLVSAYGIIVRLKGEMSITQLLQLNLVLMFSDGYNVIDKRATP